MIIARRRITVAIGAMLAVFQRSGSIWAQIGSSPMNKQVKLPAPNMDSGVSTEQVLAQRRSVRTFGKAPLSLEQVSQLLWAAQGQSHPAGYRTAPSAGALYPLELHILVGDVRGLAPGCYRYRPESHGLVRTAGRDIRDDVARAAFQQYWIAESQAIMALSAVVDRTKAKYGTRAERYVHMEAGHAAQNVYLQAAALRLGTTIVGAFDDERIHALFKMNSVEAPLSLLPLGNLPA